MAEATIIRVRRGINGHPYAACDKNGNFLFNADRLGDIRKNWIREIRWGQVQLVRELDRTADIAVLDATKEALEGILRAYGQKSKRKGRR